MGSGIAEGTRRRAVEMDALVAVASGGAAGAVLRYGVGLLWSDRAGSPSWATLLVNLLGCLVMGVVATLLDGARHRRLRPFVVVGVLGGFTTLSTFSVDVLRLVAADRLPTAFGYALVTVAGCVTAVALGALAGRRLRGVGDRA